MEASFGKKLKELRLQHKESQADLAAAIGKNIRQIQRYEGGVIPRVDTLNLLSRHYNYDFIRLIGEFIPVEEAFSVQKILTPGEQQSLEIIRIIFDDKAALKIKNILEQPHDSEASIIKDVHDALSQNSSPFIRFGDQDLINNFLQVLEDAYFSLAKDLVLEELNATIEKHRTHPTKFSGEIIRHTQERIDAMSEQLYRSISRLILMLSYPTDFNPEELTFEYVVLKFAITEKDAIDEVLEAKRNNTSDGNFVFAHKNWRGIATVPSSIQYSYIQYLDDREYVKRLPLTPIVEISFHHPWFRMFEVTGENMASELAPGNFVVAEFIDKKFYSEAASFYVYIIVTLERIVIARIVNSGQEEIICVSDNVDFFPPTRIAVSNIQEIWRVHKKLVIENVPAKKIEVDKKWGIS